jgi:hypothetical protein
MNDDPIARLRAADPLQAELPAPLERMPAPERRPARRWRDSMLVAANLVLLVTVLLHAVDHTVIQERGIGALSFEVMLGGFLITAVSVGSLAVALRGNRRASLVALVAGPWVAAAVIVGHFVPHWGEFSDPYADAGVEVVSYVLAFAVVAAGLALATIAAPAWRASR